MENQKKINNNFMNPYLGGIGLGLTLLASFLILGAGLGASSGIARIAACCELLFSKSHVFASEYFGSWGERPLHYYLVFMLGGTFIGALCSAMLSNRIRIQIERGTKSSAAIRMVFTLMGGILVGFSSRLANGCTSGQALTGSALLLTGSFVFLICIFVGGYMTAWLFRRQWND